MTYRRRVRITREGLFYAVVALTILVGGVIRQLNLLMLVGSVLAGPLLFSLIYGRLTLRRLLVERRLPSVLRAGQRLVVDINVTNQRRWLGIWTIEVEDRVRRDAKSATTNERAHCSVFFPQLVGRQVGQANYEGQLSQRGRYCFGPLNVSTSFPLGLARHSLSLEQAGELIVHPRLGSLTQHWEDFVRMDPGGSQRVHRRGLMEADFFGMRDWRPGDNQRWIHWRTSARRGSLVVRQFEQRRTQDLAILVDLWQPRDPSQRHLENVETAISFAATVIAEACRQPGRRLVLHVAAHDPIDRAGASSPWFFREQMDALALAEPHHDDGMPSPFEEALAAVPPTMPGLIVSTRAIDFATLDTAAIRRGSDRPSRRMKSLTVDGPEMAAIFRIQTP